jgi:uncharacterized protein (TIGR03083 family)
LSDVMNALADESLALSAVLGELYPHDFTRATNCPPWDLRELVVHIGATISVADMALTPAEPGTEIFSAADYYRRPQRATAAYRRRNVDSTQSLARSVLVDVSPGQWFADVSREALAVLGRQDLEQVVLIPGMGAMRLTDWVATRVTSLATHGVDVAITLGRDPWTTAPGLRVSCRVLVDLLGGPPPEALLWDEQNVLIAGTGRRPLTAQEREILGPDADRFPLLS